MKPQSFDHLSAEERAVVGDPQDYDWAHPVIEATPEMVEAIGKALHLFHPRGYCSQGAHVPAGAYHCWDEARVVIAAINGHTPREYPDQPSNALTLAAREQGRLDVQRRSRAKARKLQEQTGDR